MAGLWNAEHTLMQRYGVLRIYGRKAGDDNGRLEKPMFIVWLVTAIAFIGAYVDLEDLALKLGLDANNTRAVKSFSSASQRHRRAGAGPMSPGGGSCASAAAA